MLKKIEEKIVGILAKVLAKQIAKAVINGQDFSRLINIEGEGAIIILDLAIKEIGRLELKRHEKMLKHCKSVESIFELQELNLERLNRFHEAIYNSDKWL